MSSFNGIIGLMLVGSPLAFIGSPLTICSTRVDFSPVSDCMSPVALLSCLISGFSLDSSHNNHPMGWKWHTEKGCGWQDVSLIASLEHKAEKEDKQVLGMRSQNRRILCVCFCIQSFYVRRSIVFAPQNHASKSHFALVWNITITWSKTNNNTEVRVVVVLTGGWGMIF